MKALMFLLLSAMASAQLPDAPKPQPFALVITDTERYQQFRTKPSGTDNILGIGISYQCLKCRIVTTVSFGDSVQTGNKSFNATIAYRWFQFGKKKSP